MILVIGDGPRDSIALPKLVQHLMRKQTKWQYEDWHTRSHLFGRGKGTVYTKKVKYFTRLAKDRDCVALVVSDTDRAPYGEKLRQLRTGRDEDRQIHPPFPTAIGEANPHFDVWLLDDAHAVKTVVGCSSSAVPNIRNCTSPKDILTNLVVESDIESELSVVLGLIVDEFDVSRCNHDNETGLEEFAEEVRIELQHVV